jgi:hypothetical protein
MELVSIIRQLWRRKLLVLLVFLVAVGVSIASAYKVPSMQKRGLQLGAASSQILVDSPASTLVEGADGGTLTTLSTRARVYAQYLSSLEARDQISKISGVPARAISLSGPFSTDIPRNTYQNQPSEARANDILKEGAGYRLIFDAQDGVPIITVSAQAPTAQAAIGIARAAFVALKQYVDKLGIEADAVPVKPLPKGVTAAPVMPDPGVTVRQLGAPEGGTIGGGNSKMLMIFAFIAVLALGCALIAILPGMARHWRLLDRAERLVDALDEGGAAPPPPSPAVASDDPLRYGARPTLRVDNLSGNGGNGAPLTPDEVREADEAAARQRAASWR